MADDVAKLVMQVDPKDLQTEMAKLQRQGLNVDFKQGGVIGGKQAAMISASGTAGQVQAAYGGLAAGTKAMVSIPQAAATQTQGFMDKFLNNFGGGTRKFRDLNKSLFMLQMSSLGVVFSFQSIINSVMGMFSGLADLGTMISTGAVGSAFAGIATGGANTTDIAGSMGVTPEQMTAAWAGFTAITSQFQTVISAFAVKVLTPEMVAAILSVVDALANTLAKPDVVKAVQMLILAILEVALAIIQLIPVIAVLIEKLAETGLLKFLLLIIVAAEILLPLLAYIQFAFTAVGVIVNVAQALMVVFGASLGTLLLAVALVLIVIDFLIHLFENLANGMNPLDAVLNAVGQTVADVVNIIIGAINGLSNLFGFGSVLELWKTTTGSEPEAYSKSQTTINNINFNKNVGVKSSKEVTNAINNTSNASMG